jgi:hypothetical protein
MPVMTAPNRIVGRIIGSVMCRKRPHAPAPSIAAASCISAGTVCRPARKMMTSVPMLRHAAIAISDGMAQVVDSVQAGPSMPT